ncbi:hypothetical protein A3835_02230 [Campylobacter concisus]|uniref:Type I restriction modification DNA specificity domain-containing protein n=1 Tax=Campylobacter concisus TaxID=199 RepID=A0A1X0U2Q1_9BACT|nr:hypothetical protein A3835_02230 [Campylobacter concisus]
MQIANSLFDELGVKWGEFKLVDLFDYERGTRLTKNNRENGIYPLVTAGEINLGVKEFIDNKNQKVFNNAITIDMFCNSFVHINDFCCDDNVLVLTSKAKISTQVMHFISAVINKSKDKFGYGRQYRQNTLEKHIVHLPIDKFGKPNFTLMENFIKDIEKKHTQKLINYHKFLTMGGNRAEFNLAYYEKIQNLEWKEFKIDDLFEIKKGKRLTKSQMKDGNINFIGATSTNNGITAKISNDTHLHPSNTISVTYNGSVGEAFYQPSRFWASDDVNVLYPKFKNNKFLSLFFATIFRKQGQKYGYNRKWTKEIMQEDKVLLPTYGDRQIAFDFIEEYISQVQNKMRDLLLLRD